MQGAVLCAIIRPVMAQAPAAQEFKRWRKLFLIVGPKPAERPMRKR